MTSRILKNVYPSKNFNKKIQIPKVNFTDFVVQYQKFKSLHREDLDYEEFQEKFTKSKSNDFSKIVASLDILRNEDQLQIKI